MNKSRIPTRKKVHCVDKLKKLYEDWRNLQKSSKKTSQTQKEHEANFVSELDKLFDIAHAEAINKIKIPEDRLFLENQRKNRQGSICGIDLKLSKHEELVENRKRKYEEYSRKQQESSSVLGMF